MPLILSWTLVDHFVDQAVFLRSFCTHEVVAIGIAFDFFQSTAAVLGHQRVQSLADEEDFLGMDFDIRSLALKPPSGW